MAKNGRKTHANKFRFGVMMGLVLNLPPESTSFFFLKGEAVSSTSIRPYGELTPCNGTSWNPFEGPQTTTWDGAKTL